MKDASMPQDQTHGREHQNLGNEVREWHDSRVYKTVTRGAGHEGEGGRRTRRIRKQTKVEGP